jgi:hypothetical protein
MNKIVQYTGLDVHKDSIAFAIAPQNSAEMRRYGIMRKRPLKRSQFPSAFTTFKAMPAACSLPTEPSPDNTIAAASCCYS